MATSLPSPMVSLHGKPQCQPVDTLMLATGGTELDLVSQYEREAAQEMFKVKVVAINTLNVRGKSRRRRTTKAGKAADWKEAVVTLRQGDKNSRT